MSSCKSYAESAGRTLAHMVCDFGKSVAVAGLLDQRYTVCYPFSVTAEILELETGSRLRGVTSDLSPRGCFVRTASLPEVRTRVRLTLARKTQKVEILAAIRRAAQTGMAWSSWRSTPCRMQFHCRGSRISESLAKTSALGPEAAGAYCLPTMIDRCDVPTSNYACKR